MMSKDATTCLHPFLVDPGPLVINVGPWYRGTIRYISYIVGSGDVKNGFLDIFINNKLCMFRICLSAAFYSHLDMGVLGWIEGRLFGRVPWWGKETRWSTWRDEPEEDAEDGGGGVGRGDGSDGGLAGALREL